MATYSQAQRIRDHVNRTAIEPARKAGRAEAVVVAGDVHKDLKLINRVPAVCAALDAQRFQEQYGVRLIARSGPRQSPTVSWRFSL